MSKITKVPEKTIKKIKRNIPTKVATPTVELTELAALSIWDKIKAKIKSIGLVFAARVIAIVGFITGVVGSMDLSPLWSLFGSGTEFNWKQLVFLGISILGMGITMEIARRKTTDA